MLQPTRVPHGIPEVVKLIGEFERAVAAKEARYFGMGLSTYFVQAIWRHRIPVLKFNNANMRVFIPEI